MALFFKYSPLLQCWHFIYLTKAILVSSPFKLQSSFMDGPKALGLPPKSEKLFDIIPNIVTNMAGIAGNLASIGSINEDITNLKSCQTSKKLAVNMS